MECMCARVRVCMFAYVSNPIAWLWCNQTKNLKDCCRKRANIWCFFFPFHSDATTNSHLFTLFTQTSKPCKQTKKKLTQNLTKPRITLLQIDQLCLIESMKNVEITEIKSMRSFNSSGAKTEIVKKIKSLSGYQKERQLDWLNKRFNLYFDCCARLLKE